jgi:membrane fusion protein (multidrug efflux system)
MAFSSTSFRIAAVIAVAALAAGVYILLHLGEQSTDDAAIAAHIVTISPKVSGYVKALHIDDNQIVKAGDVLMEIDPQDYQIRVDHARAALEAAEAGHNASRKTLETTRISAPSSLEAAKAQVDAARANWEKAANDLKRMQRLGDEARSREQLDAAVAAEKNARSQLEDTKAKLRSAETAPKVIASAKSNADEQEAGVKQAQANLEQAEKDLNDTKILAPMDGRITNRSVERGDYVQPGQQLTSLVGTELWVVANYKETQLTKMHIGDKADIRVDAFPNAKLEGKIDSFQYGTGARFSAFPPENATGNFVKIVQRVPVKIVFTRQPDPKLTLGPGMSVVPTVYTK